MALTYRTGSDGKGSALTNDELDNNFRYFTGSHSITGSLGITGDLNVEGNITNTTPTDLTGSFEGNFTGSLTGSLTGSHLGPTIGDLTGSFTGSIDGNEVYITNLPLDEPSESGRLWLSGSAENSKYLMVRD